MQSELYFLDLMTTAQLVHNQTQAEKAIVETKCRLEAQEENVTRYDNELNFRIKTVSAILGKNLTRDEFITLSRFSTLGQ